MGPPSFTIHKQADHYHIVFCDSTGYELPLSIHFANPQACLEGILLIMQVAALATAYERRAQDNGLYSMQLRDRQKQLLAEARDIPSVQQREALIDRCIAEMPTASILEV